MEISATRLCISLSLSLSPLKINQKAAIEAIELIDTTTMGRCDSLSIIDIREHIPSLQWNHFPQSIDDSLVLYT